jgi:hypothetical protein
MRLKKHASEAIRPRHFPGQHGANDFPHFLFWEAKIWGGKVNNRQTQQVEVQAMHHVLKITQDDIIVIKHQLCLLCFINEYGIVVLELINEIFLASVIGLQVEKLGVGISLPKAGESWPLSSDRSGQGGDTKTPEFEFFA